MFINKDSVIINGVSMGQYLTEAEFSYPKLWSSDSGRSLAGNQTGTLIGIFPKLILNFRRLNLEEVNLLAPIFDSASQTVQYDDDNKGKKITIDTYSGDWSIKNKKLKVAENFSISFISRRRRT